VALIWSTIGYKIINSIASSNTNAPFIEVNTTPKDTSVIPDTFSIMANYPDPFLWQGNDTTKSNGLIENAEPANNNKNYNENPEPQPVVIPPVKYLGFIKNKNGKNKLAIITVRGQEITVKEKDIIDDITILRIDKSSLSIKFHGSKYDIRLENQ